MSLPPLFPRNCPACDGSGYSLIHAHPLAVIEGVSLHAGYNVVACDHCGMVYANGLPAQAAFDHYYEASSKYEDHTRGGLPSPVDQARFEAIAEGLAAHLDDRGAAILDFGCSTGGLLKALKARGFTRLAGVDPSPQCGRSVREIHGIQAHQGTLFTPIPEGPWDVVTAVGVLEHVRDFSRAVLNLREGIRDGGLLYVELPDLEGFHRTNEAPFQEFSTEHINFFSPRSLDTAMGRLGLVRAFGEIVTRIHSGGSTMQVIAFSYRKEAIPAAHSPEFDREGPEAARRYAAQCAAQSAPELQQARELADSGQPIAIWGAGTVACRLLATTELAKAPIVGIVDSNPHLQGKRLAGHAIHPPKWLEGFSGTIFVASRGYAAEIERTIHETLGLKNRIVLLA